MAVCGRTRIRVYTYAFHVCVHARARVNVREHATHGQTCACVHPLLGTQVNVYLLLGLRSLACASCIPCTALMHAARPTHSEPPIRFGSFSGGAFTPPEFTPPHSASPTNSNGHAGSGGSSGNGNGGGGLSGYGFSGMCAGSFARTVDVSGSRVQAPAAGEGGARWGSVPRLKIRNDGS